MASDDFVVFYRAIESVRRPSSSTMRKYLAEENEIWANFFVLLKERRNEFRGSSPQEPIDVDTLVGVFDNLSAALDDRRRFNRQTEAPSPGALPPPPSTTVEGQLILGLLENNRKAEALDAYVCFISRSLPRGFTGNIAQRVTRGERLIDAAHVAAALPFKKVSSQRIGGAARSAEAYVERLKEEVQRASEINVSHASDLGDFHKEAVEELDGVISELSKRKSEIEAAVIEKIKRGERRIEALRRLSERYHAAQEAEFQRIKDIYLTQMRYRAPSDLWDSRATEHRDRSKTAFIIFLALVLLAVAAGILVPFLAGDYIANSFFVTVCDTEIPPNCDREFSAKGPLTVGGILLTLTLVLWAIRLQYRVYLSERHLSLDASEKQAFAQAFLAMKEDQSVDDANEAIVLGALFRPTQDGIIKDDESTVDISAVAILARQLGRGPS